MLAILLPQLSLRQVMRWVGLPNVMVLMLTLYACEGCIWDPGSYQDPIKCSYSVNTANGPLTDRRWRLVRGMKSWLSKKQMDSLWEWACKHHIHIGSLGMAEPALRGKRCRTISKAAGTPGSVELRNGLFLCCQNLLQAGYLSQCITALKIPLTCFPFW